jgi:tripartite-type tricarboxylate transporter receptor subunit TctC
MKKIALRDDLRPLKIAFFGALVWAESAACNGDSMPFQNFKTAVQALAQAFTLSAFVVSAMPAAAQSPPWPGRSISLVSVTAPGGNSDVLARLIATPLSQVLKVPVVVENKPGGLGVVAGSHVVKSAPDGYTLMAGSIATHGTAPLTNKNLPYDVVKDFAPVTLIGMNHNVLVVPASSPFKTVGDVIAQARAMPGTVSYASPGTGGTQALSGRLLEQRAKVQLLNVPSGRGAPLHDVVAGHINMMFEGASVLPLIQNGTLRALAVTSRQRLAQLPSVPTMEEAGVPDFEVMSWHGIFAPAGTPSAVVEKLHAAIAQVLAQPEVQQRMAQLGLTVSGMSPQQLAAFQQAEIGKWAAVLKATGISTP